jgi:LemA protein
MHTIFFLLLLAIPLCLFFYGVALYNRLVRGKNLVAEGWSGIDVQLKRRTDLIPNLVETVKGYAGHERQVLEQVTNLRAQSLKAGPVGERSQVEGRLSAALGQLLAVAENYPDLKANQNFLELQRSLADIEEQIQLARRYYNGAARDFNILIESFPSNLLAQKFRFNTVEFFELEDEAHRQTPKVSFPG